jgi:hypothetical protein
VVKYEKERALRLYGYDSVPNFAQLPAGGVDLDEHRNKDYDVEIVGGQLCGYTDGQKQVDQLSEDECLQYVPGSEPDCLLDGLVEKGSEVVLGVHLIY